MTYLYTDENFHDHYACVVEPGSEELWDCEENAEGYLIPTKPIKEGE